MTEVLNWDGEDLEGPIVCEDLAPLRSFATRGANTLLPGAPGTSPNAPLMDELDVTLTWFVSGRFDPAGTPNADQEIGVEENLEHYRTLFTTGQDPATGEHDIVLSFAASTFTAGAQLRDYAQARTGPTTARIITRLIIAAGELEETLSS